MAQEAEPTAPATASCRSGRGTTHGRERRDRGGSGGSIGPVRAAGGAGLATAGGVLLTAWFVRFAVQPLPATARIDDLLVRALSAAGAALALWLTVGSVLAALAHAPGGCGRVCDRWAERIAPLALRRVASVLLGATVVSAVVPGIGSERTSRAASPAGYSLSAAAVGAGPGLIASTDGPTPAPGAPPTPRPSPAPRPTAAPGPTPLDGAAPSPDPGVAAHPSPSLDARPGDEPPPAGWLPTPPPGRAPDPSLVASPARRAVPIPAPEPVAVRRGDTLWGIVTRHLGPGRDPRRVAAEVPRWYAANRTVIGPDPDLIQPGTLLRPPP